MAFTDLHTISEMFESYVVFDYRTSLDSGRVIDRRSGDELPAEERAEKRSSQNDWYRRQYANNAAFREKALAAGRAFRARPEWRDTHRDAMREHRSVQPPETRKQIDDRAHANRKVKMERDPEYAERVRAQRRLSKKLRRIRCMTIS